MSTLFRRCPVLSLLVLLTAQFVAAAQEAGSQADALAKQVVGLCGKSKGVCLLMNGGDLALALARHSEFLVVDQERDPKAVTAVRAAADAAGVLGRTVYVAEADPGHPVLADNYANLVIVTDVSDASLTTLDAKALLRVATPHGGRILVGHAAGGPGTLTQANLATWAKGLGLPGASVAMVEDASGLWLKAVKPQLPGATEWTHRLFDSSFNPVSTDTAFTMPTMTQWLDTPYNHGAGAPRIAGGRLLMVMEGQYNSRRYCDVNHLIMRDAYNGQILWSRDLGTQYAADFYLSTCVVTAEAVYLIDMPKPVVLVLDPETGRELRKIDCSLLGKMVKWIAVQDGVLYVAAGEPDRTGGPWSGVYGAMHVKFVRENTDSLAHSVQVGNNRVIAALDAKTGEVLWRHEEERDCIPEYLIAVRKSRLFFLAQDKYVRCLDATSGKPLWANPSAADIYRKNLHPQFAVGTAALMASDDTILVSRPGSSRISMDAADGRVLWSAKFGGHQQTGSLIWSHYVLGQTSVDLRTGQVPPEFAARGANPYRGACTFLCATNRYITGMNGAVYDLTLRSDVPRPTNLHKSPCSMGSVVGEGLIFLSSFHCACSYQLNGNIVEMPGNGRDFQAPAVERDRLTHAQEAGPVRPLAAGPTDWPAFRGGNDRGNASQATVPDRVARRWVHAPAFPYVNPPYPSDRSLTSYEPVQPIAVANLVITSGPDGVVRALDLASGKPSWTFRTGGQIAQSPAVADSRAYVPSGDGFVYCLEAATGRELWRFRAAPAERRMMAYGHLVSTWPLFAGVLVQDGVVYTAASLLNMNATHVYALDAKTGHILWQNNTSGLPHEKSEDGATTVGTLTVAQGRLWVRATSYDLKTGQGALCADAKSGAGPNGGNALLHRNTGVIQRRFLLFGGRRFYESQSRPLPIGRSPQQLSIIELTTDGTGILPRIDLVEYTGAFAAWDGRQLIVTPVTADKTSLNEAIKHSPVVCWDLAKTLSLVQAERANAVAKVSDYASKVKWDAMIRSKNSWERMAELPMHQWLLDTHRTYAVALAANAVVAAYGLMDAPEELKGVEHVVPTKWYAAALDRTTGKELWKEPLPSEPVHDGLCIAPNGSVIVQLLDGGTVCLGQQNGP